MVDKATKKSFFLLVHGFERPQAGTALLVNRNSLLHIVDVILPNNLAPRFALAAGGKDPSLVAGLDSTAAVGLAAGALDQGQTSPQQRIRGYRCQVTIDGIRENAFYAKHEDAKAWVKERSKQKVDIESGAIERPRGLRPIRYLRPGDGTPPDLVGGGRRLSPHQAHTPGLLAREPCKVSFPRQILKSRPSATSEDQL